MDEEPKARRRPHTKSRNGCVTCKKRRVKCDESHPSCKNCRHLKLQCQYLHTGAPAHPTLQMMELKLFHHYVTAMGQTIAQAGIGTTDVWVDFVTEKALEHHFLMHAVLMFSATHLAQSDPKTYETAVVTHRSESLRLLRQEMQDITEDKVDPLYAASILMTLDALANASLPTEMTICSLPASAWLHHVRGSATILLALGELPPTSRFYHDVGVEFADLVLAMGSKAPSIEIFDNMLSDLYPLLPESPYAPTLRHLEGLTKERHVENYIMRVFSFPAVGMDQPFLDLLSQGDPTALRIIAAYYEILRSYCRDHKDKIWFLKGVSNVLPIDMDVKGGLGFITSALPVTQSVESMLARFDAAFTQANDETEEALSMYFYDDPESPGVGSHFDVDTMSPQTLANQQLMPSSTLSPLSLGTQMKHTPNSPLSSHSQNSPLLATIESAELHHSSLSTSQLDLTRSGRDHSVAELPGAATSESHIDSFIRRELWD